MFVADVNLRAAEELAPGFDVDGLPVSSVELDIRDYDSISRCVDEVVASAGSLDVWVNSAYPKIRGSCERSWRTCHPSVARRRRRPPERLQLLLP